MGNKLDLTGSDFSLEINNLEYGELCAADIEYMITLPVSELKKIGYFLEEIVGKNRNEKVWGKNFLITVSELDEKSQKLELICTNLTTSIPVHLINIDFEFVISAWTEKLNKEKLDEISVIQSKTWLNSKADMENDDISKIWDRFWRLNIEEIK